MSDEAARFFDAIARRYDRVYALSGADSKERMKRVLAAIGSKKEVLVLGIGTGRELPALLDAGHVPTGFDISAEMIALCNKRSRTCPIVQGDFWRPLPFGDGSFDAVIALHGTLAHPPSLEALSSLAKELVRVMRPSGIFVAEVPAGEATIAAEREGLAVEETKDGFVHHDAVANVSIRGILLRAEQWRAALSPLAVKASPLGDREHLLVAMR